MSFAFFFDSDEYRRLKENQRMIVEIDLQQRLICQKCQSEKADTWIRNLTVRNNDGSYAEFLLGPLCRAKFGIERPTEYKCENNIEVMKVMDEAESRKVGVE